MKKVLFSLLVASVVMVSFHSCKGKDDEPKGKTELKVNGAIIKAPYEEKFSDDAMIVAFADESKIGEAKIVDNKFQLKLEKPSDDMLKSIPKEMIETIKVSNKNAKIIVVDNFKLKQNGDIFGSFLYTNTDFHSAIKEAKRTGLFKSTVILYAYSDRSTNISGTYTEEGVYNSVNLKLKKGWNYVKLYTESLFDDKDDNQSAIIPKNELTTISSVTSDYQWVFFSGGIGM